MKGIVDGLSATMSPKGLGAALGVVLVLAALYAFAPAFSPEGLANRIRPTR